MAGSTSKMLAQMGGSNVNPVQEHSNDATNPLDAPQLRPKADMGNELAEMLKSSHSPQHSPMD